LQPAAAAIPAGTQVRGLTEPLTQQLAVRNTSTANLLDDEDRVPVSPADCAADRTRRQVRQLTALELRNQSAAAALDRFYQLADAESRLPLLRDTLPILDGLRDKAGKAKAAGLRFPLDAGELDRQRFQLLAQLEQGEAGAKVLGIDLRRRLGLPPSDDRLWPTGGFAVDPELVNPSAAVDLALAERPELKAWRELQAGMTPETLPLVREQLRGVNPLAAASAAGVALPCGMKLLLAIAKCLGRTTRSEAAEQDELEVRRKQVADVLADRERAVADEARAAAVALNAQTRRVALTRDRADSLKAKLDDARRQQEAKVAGADLLAAQAEIEWLKARAEVAAEVMAWHAARVRLKAAVGRLAVESAKPPPSH
jgi:hypothetical protein